MSEHELRLIYGGVNAKPSNIGVLQQDPLDLRAGRHRTDWSASISPCLAPPASANRTASPSCCSRFSTNGPTCGSFLIDPHNEYGRCFGDKAQVLTPRNLRLPFWLFNFEETVDAFFGGRPGVEEEVEILSEAIPEAKAAYLHLKSSSDRALAKKKDPRSAGYGVDTPVPYRIEDLIAVIDERMGKLENRSRARPTTSCFNASRPSATIRATASCSRTPPSAATPWRRW